jgi:hypothetical protein
MADVFQFRIGDQVEFTLDGVRQTARVVQALGGTLLVQSSRDDSQSLVVSTLDIKVVHRKRATYYLDHGIVEGPR